ncbi:hypothetical protein [Kribbella alba]
MSDDVAMPRSHAKRDRRSLKRRLEVLKLPVLPLTHHGYLEPTDRSEWPDEPEAVGVGPEGMAYAVWRHSRDARRKQVTSHVGGSDIATAVEVKSDLRVWFVQSLPEGRLLLAAARRSDGAAPNAEVWSDGGELLLTGDLGDAIEELMTTPAGSVWVGYFDEALGGSGPQGHGLARFTPDLSPDWLYPINAGLPPVFDCYTLNVHAERAYICPYTDFHLISIADGKAVDLGVAPHRSAHGLLMRGGEGAFLGGWGPEYDLVTPIRITREGVETFGSQCRIVMPDGTEAQGLRYTFRGDTLHAFHRGTWYVVTLNDLFAANARG